MITDANDPGWIAEDMRTQNDSQQVCWTKFEFIAGPQAQSVAEAALRELGCSVTPDGSSSILRIEYPRGREFDVANVCRRHGGRYWGRKFSRV